ncbi:MAG: PAS domain S-box protein, partial [Candidatus Lokiarchaeota archaeon]|nr:PAS domain S-box protein [Candidatus Lokiarchaeota archaeon]
MQHDEEYIGNLKNDKDFKISYREIINNVRDGIIIVGLDGRFKYISPQIKEMLGGREIKINSLLFDFLHPSEINELKKKFLKAVRNQGVLTEKGIEFRVKDNNSHYIWLEARTKNHYNNKGTLIGFIISVRDITKSKKLQFRQQKLLYEQQILNKVSIKVNREENIDRICGILGEAIQSFNKDSYVIVTLYDKKLDALRIRGLFGLGKMNQKIKEIINKNFEDISVQTMDMANESNLYKAGKFELISGGLYRLTSRKTPKYMFKDIEKRLNINLVYTIGFSLGDKPYGGVIICLQTGKNLQHTEIIETLVNHISVIINHRFSEKELRESEEKLSSIIKGLSRGKIAIDIINKDYKIIYQSQLLKERFGDNIGELCYKTYIHREKPCESCKIKKVLKENKVYSIELIGMDGRYYEIISIPFSELDNKRNKVIEVIIDITNRKKVENQLKESEEKYRILAENTQDVIWTMDFNFNYNYISPSIE